MAAPSSPSVHDDDIPTATLALPSAPRRLPPPCWSPDETVALIDAYKEKWYSLRRGNLRANHWQEVAEDVAARCPANPTKTAVQCRHKMEKLRKRHRSEIQRAAARGGVRRFTSSWVHFQNMRSMEKGPNPSSSSSDDDEEDFNNNSVKRVHDLYNYNEKSVYGAQNNGAGGGFRIRIPGGGSAGPKVYSKFDGAGGNYNRRFANYGAGGPSKIMQDNFGGIGKGDGEMAKRGDGLNAVAAAINGLGEGFMRIEKAKMDMVQQIEEMRMEMELKRTEMLLESEQRIIQAIAQETRAKRSSTTPHGS